MTLRLPQNRQFRLLWTASVVSQLGDWSTRLAVALLVRDQTGTAWAVGLVAVIYVLPWLGPGQVLASLGDRVDRRRLLLLCDTGRGVAFIAIGVLQPPLLILFVALAIAATLDPVFEATRAAYLVDVVTDDEYPDAIRSSHLADQVAQLSGFALGGVLVAALSAPGTLVANGATFWLSALLISRITVRSMRTERPARPSLARALGFLRSDSIAGIATAMTVITVGGAAAVEAMSPIYGQSVASLSDAWVGLLTAAVPVGTALAVALTTSDGGDTSLLRRGYAVAAVAALPASVLLYAGATGPLAFGAFGLVGATLVLSTMANVVVGRRIPEDARASTFAVLQAFVFIAFSLGSGLGGVFSDIFGVATATGTAAAISAGACAVMLAVSRRSERPGWITRPVDGSDEHAATPTPSGTDHDLMTRPVFTIDPETVPAIERRPRPRRVRRGEGRVVRLRPAAGDDTVARRRRLPR